MILFFLGTNPRRADIVMKRRKRKKMMKTRLNDHNKDDKWRLPKLNDGNDCTPLAPFKMTTKIENDQKKGLRDFWIWRMPAAHSLLLNDGNDWTCSPFRCILMIAKNAQKWYLNFKDACSPFTSLKWWQWLHSACSAFRWQQWCQLMIAKKYILCCSKVIF